MKKAAYGLTLTAFVLFGCHTITEELPSTPSAGPTPQPTSKPSKGLLTIPIPAGLGATPTPMPAPAPTPGPTPAPTPAPSPSPPPGPVGACGNPLPPLPINHFNVKIHIPGPNRDTLDSTPIVGPDKAYCAAVGYTDGRLMCPVRAEGIPDRSACEEYAVGHAEDTGRPGPTWYRNGQLCDGVNCENHEDNQYLLYANTSGRYEACSQDGVCGAVDVVR